MARQKARNLKNALEHATMYTTARACGITVSCNTTGQQDKISAPCC